MKPWTPANVLTIAPPADCQAGEITIWHPKMERFGIRFRRDRKRVWGGGTYTIEYYQGGRDHRIPLGKVGAVALDAAVGEAQKIRADLVRHLNPAKERKVAKAAHDDTFAARVPEYIAELRRQNCKTRYIGQVERYLTRYFPGLEGLAVTLIEQKDVAAALTKLLTPCAGRWQGGKGTATDGRSALSGYCEWLACQGLIKGNPVNHTTRYAEPARERALTEDELATVLAAVDDEHRFGRILRLLVLTGCRRDQIGWLQRDWLDLDAPVPTITFPGRAAAGAADIRGGSKNGKAFVIPLCRQAVAILRRQLAENPNAQFVFGAQRDAEVGYQSYKDGMRQLRNRLGDKIAHWTLHDLRRTFATLALSVLDGKVATQQLAVLIDVALNHTIPGISAVGGRYQKNQLVPERVPLMQAWADYCDGLTPAKPRLALVA